MEPRFVIQTWVDRVARQHDPGMGILPMPDWNRRNSSGRSGVRHDQADISNAKWPSAHSAHQETFRT